MPWTFRRLRTPVLLQRQLAAVQAANYDS